MMSTELLGGYLARAKEAALRGAAVLEEWRLRFRVAEKGRCDLVTDADLASQQTIRDFFCDHFPDHDFLGEEDKQSRRCPGLDAPPTWIVDPLDGTTNYVHDCPCYCVSIGLQVAGELVVGVVYDPTRRELFAAARGLGAWLGERRIEVSRTSRLENALLATGFPADMRGQERALAWWRQLSLHSQSLRRTGSTALNLAYVAAGRFDGYWAFDNFAWDVAGGVVLIREAGGMVTNIDGSSFDPFTADSLATNGPMHPVLLEFFRRGL
jgi:myo-inositol-1(or 4)-monophosphatase